MKDALQKKILLFSFLAIPTILLLLFTVYPFLKLIIGSFQNWNGIDSATYAGFSNYKQLFTRKDILKAFSNNGIYFILHLIFIPLEVYIAVLLDKYIEKKEFFKSIVFMPYIINGVAIAYMFSFLFSSEEGTLNMILQLFNIDKVQWLSNPKIVNYSLAIVSLWRFTGVHVILFLAGFQSISKDMLEAAEVDGANIFVQFYKIIIPNMKAIISIVLFLNVRGALMVFDIPFVMTSGGPGNTSSTFALNIVKTAFEFNNFGLACAMAIIMIILILLISLLQNIIFDKEKRKSILEKIRL
ncbi:MAG: carbohydrate ABC transporter permease [Fusobacteriaceae bacterium]